MEAKGKKCGDRLPIPPRTWHKLVPFYADQWKDRATTSILLKVRTLGKEREASVELGNPSLIHKDKQWWLHPPLEKNFISPAKIVTQLTAISTTLYSVDLNLGDNIALCTIQTVEGTILDLRASNTKTTREVST